MSPRSTPASASSRSRRGEIPRLGDPGPGVLARQDLQVDPLGVPAVALGEQQLDGGRHLGVRSRRLAGRGELLEALEKHAAERVHSGDDLGPERKFPRSGRTWTRSSGAASACARSERKTSRSALRKP